ncbi:MAG: hypothetical protein PHN45_02135 [Methylococcales bacterium]|nr:hypothetical protein [Methylococcales bacterium]
MNQFDSFFFQNVFEQLRQLYAADRRAKLIEYPINQEIAPTDGHMLYRTCISKVFISDETHEKLQKRMLCLSISRLRFTHNNAMYSWNDKYRMWNTHLWKAIYTCDENCINLLDFTLPLAKVENVASLHKSGMHMHWLTYNAVKFYTIPPTIQESKMKVYLKTRTCEYEPSETLSSHCTYPGAKITPQHESGDVRYFIISYYPSDKYDWNIIQFCDGMFGMEFKPNKPMDAITDPSDPVNNSIH